MQTAEAANGHARLTHFEADVRCPGADSCNFAPVCWVHCGRVEGSELRESTNFLFDGLRIRAIAHALGAKCMHNLYGGIIEDRRNQNPDGRTTRLGV